MFRVFLFLIGFGFSVVGFLFLIAYLNLFPLGYNFKEYVQFISKRIECISALIGLLCIACSIYLPRRK